MFRFWAFGPRLTLAFFAVCLLGGMPCIAGDGPLEGTARPAVWVDDAIQGRDSLDLVWIGDSNTGFESCGWVDGFHAALIDAGAETYGTPLFTGYNSGNEVGLGCRWFLGLEGQALRGSSAASSPQWAKDSFALGGGKLLPFGSQWSGGTESTWMDFAYVPSGSSLSPTSAAVWIYHKRNDPSGGHSVEAPYRINPDAELVYRLNAWAGAGSVLQIQWRRYANSASLQPPTTVPPTQAGQWTTIEDVLPAGDRTPQMTAANDGISVLINGQGGTTSPLVGPVAIGLHSVYRRVLGVSSHSLQYRGGATLSQLLGEVTSASDGAVRTFLKEVHDRQVAAGGSGRVLICIQGGINLGDWWFGFPFFDTVLASMRTSTQALRAAWQSAGLDPRDLAFLIIVSHATESGDAVLGLLRDAVEDDGESQGDVAFADLGVLAPYEYLEAGDTDTSGHDHGFYDSTNGSAGSHSHLNVQGYLSGGIRVQWLPEAKGAYTKVSREIIDALVAPGACCLDEAGCFPDLRAGDCDALGGRFVLGTNDCSDLDANGFAEACGNHSPGDLNGDGIVNGSDLTILLSAWGTADPIADIDGDGEVHGADLTILLGAWTG